MILVLDTCVLLYEALDPPRVSPGARAAIDDAERDDLLWCSDISFWEVAMLIERGRLGAPPDLVAFLRDLAEARAIRVQPIVPEIAALTSRLGLHEDPADRIIALW